jgi:hypothetical protein
MDVFDELEDKERMVKQIRDESQKMYDKVCFYEVLEDAYSEFLKAGETSKNAIVKDFSFSVNGDDDIKITYIGAEKKYQEFKGCGYNIFDIFSDIKNNIINSTERNNEVLKELAKYKRTELDDEVISQLLD